MKKIEALLNGLNDTNNGSEGVLIVLLCLLFEVLGIWGLIKINTCIILSPVTFWWVFMISNFCIDKVFFSKLHNYLLKTPNATSLILWIIFIVGMAISIANNFVGFIGLVLLVILAFFLADFVKFKLEDEVEVKDTKMNTKKKKKMKTQK